MGGVKIGCKCGVFVPLSEWDNHICLEEEKMTICPVCEKDISTDTHECIELSGEDNFVEQAPDQVFRPSHYTQWKGMEPLTFFILNNIPFAEASICKYVLRWNLKNGIEDLRKARRIIDMLIEMEEHRDLYTPEKTCL